MIWGLGSGVRGLGFGVWGFKKVILGTEKKNSNLFPAETSVVSNAAPREAAPTLHPEPYDLHPGSLHHAERADGGEEELEAVDEREREREKGGTC